MAEGCAFCRIVAGESPADIVLDAEHAIAFLDHRPVFPGHVLLVPRDHIPTMEDLPASAVGPLFATVRLLASAVQGALEAEGTFVAVNNRVSQSVPHLHVHIVPRRRGDGLRGFFWPRRLYDDDAHRSRVAEAVRRAVRELESP